MSVSTREELRIHSSILTTSKMLHRPKLNNSSQIRKRGVNTQQIAAPKTGETDTSTESCDFPELTHQQEPLQDPLPG